MRTVRFKCLGWSGCDIEDDEEHFYVNGVTEKNKTVLIRVDKFTPFVYVELPKVRWDEYHTSTFFSFLQSRLKRYAYKDEERDFSPLKCVKKRKFVLYGKIPTNYLMLTFRTHAACCTLQSFLNRANTIRDLEYELGFKLQKDSFKVHEQNVDPLLKMTAYKKIGLCSWIEVTEYYPEDVTSEPNFSYADISMYVDYHDITPVVMPATIQPRIRVLSFDLECRSINHNSKLPDPTEPKNYIVQISAHLWHSDVPGVITKHLFTIKKGRDVKVEDTMVYNFRTEKAMLLTFKNFIVKHDPDVFLGYNILKFDWQYIITRVDLLGIYQDFLEFSRIKGERANVVKKNWSSSAYGDQTFQYVECPGRLNLDLIIEMERNFKLDYYNLDFVSEKFLGDNKKSLSAKQLFKLYDFAENTEPYFEYENISTKVLKEIKQYASSFFEDEDGVVKEYKDSILNSKTSSVLKHISNAMNIIGEYCVHDSVLPIKLLIKSNTLHTATQLASVYNVPISYLQTRGQQIKCLAQVLRKTMHNNYVIPYKRIKEEEEYEGATVIDAVKGYYEDIATLDFTSLYPTIMIANNIDYTTYATHMSHIPDNMCNIVEWESHVNCSHDPKIKKKKVVTKVVDVNKPEPKRKKKVVCGKFRERWLKAGDNQEAEGVLPQILRGLLSRRTEIKNEMAMLNKQLKENNTLSESEKFDIELRLVILDAEQLAVKISANSVYGATGAKQGFMPLIPAAASVTARGREYINRSIQYILKNFQGSQLVYGDSVVGDTPILVRDKDKSVDIISIDELNGVNRYKPYDNFKIFDQEIRTEKQYSECDYEVWTDKGWSKIKKVIRHKANKSIFRVNTHTGCVDVTEDHSLLTPNLEKVKPKDVKIGDKLLSSFCTDFENFTHVNVNNIKSEQPMLLCKKCGENKVIDEFHMGSQNPKRYDRTSYCKKCRCKNYFSEYEYSKPYSLTKDEAFVWGFFMADGSCGKYTYSEDTKYSWAINNQNLEYLNRTKQILETVEPTYKFKILNTMDSSNVYKLIPVGHLKHIVLKYRNLFYDKNKYKKVPKVVLNAKYEIRQSFYDGYYIGDGCKTTNYDTFSNKGKIGSQGLWFLCRSLGKQNMHLNIRSDKENIYRIQSFKGKIRKEPDAIKKIISLGTTSDFVYDLETECGRFQAGVGEIIVKNTDSCMINFGVGKKLEEVFTLARKASEECSALFPPPVKLLLECVYGKFFLLTKKRYIAWKVDKEGKVYEKVKKGVVAKRRDNTHYLKMVYNQLTDDIMTNVDERNTLYNLYENIQKLFTRRVPDKDLIIYKGIKTLLGYAKTAELNDPCGKTEIVKYRDSNGYEKEREENVKLKYYIDVNAPKGKDVLLIDKVLKDKRGRPIDITHPLDPRLKYNSDVHVQLALKMMRRGEDVPPNTRLQYIFLDNGQPSTLQYEKAEEYTFYKENKHALRLKLDSLYYLEKQLIIPITEALNVKFRRNAEYQYKTPDERLEEMEQIADKLDPNLKKSFERIKGVVCSPQKENPVRYCSLKEHQKRLEDIVKTIATLNEDNQNNDFLEEKNITPSTCVMKGNYCKHQTYKIAIDLYSRSLKDDMKKRFDEYVNVCFLKKSIGVLERIEKRFGLKKKRGGRMVDRTRVRDGNIMNDILRYRTGYRDVVRHLNELFDPIVFEE